MPDLEEIISIKLNIIKQSVNLDFKIHHTEIIKNEEFI